MSSKLRVAAIGAWLLVAAYYFYQYALRSAPDLQIGDVKCLHSGGVIQVSDETNDGERGIHHLLPLLTLA